jgi:hypothetical protein
MRKLRIFENFGSFKTNLLPQPFRLEIISTFLQPSTRVLPNQSSSREQWRSLHEAVVVVTEAVRGVVLAVDVEEVTVEDLEAEEVAEEALEVSPT